ncbi:catalase [Faunimonas pinastri]|uniref:Catalase n=1 Tax=Faunimonas pinastri TaxID=1855383 RepID=A0A1H9AFY6_9HYPH|nr:catalase [Faunimonas pinastri]SEP75610.1 catalase [Faunimonas pinastri]
MSETVKRPPANATSPANAASPVDATSKDRDLQRDLVDPGERMTTNQGLLVSDDQNSLKAGLRGPTLMEDFHFREKMTHFDHERIPERVVHARGVAAHGYFESYGSATDITQAGLFSEKGKQTPMFIRFSTVAGSRGSADTPRDVRGFAMKFYTDEGVWDLVGNNIPIFFIQDAIKFPDLIHAVKPEPHNEIPQAQSAHDTFWDFASLTPEITHMLMWVMSDRALPRSLATMQGFGIHTFRFVTAEGVSSFVKFHLKPKKGIHSLVWDEAQKIAGKDPDFNRRDLFDAIERGDYPEWEFGVQVVPEEDEMKFDFDILDPTKIIPEEDVPVRMLGKIVLNRNVDNYFAETEQVAFHPGHVVPGIDFSNDPLLQGRLFSYIDTQLRRVGPNFAELPINRPVCPVHNNQRDAMARQTINKGRVSYFPNSLGNGCPAHSPEGMKAFVSYAEKIDGVKIRQRSPSFGDHFSQATLFWNSMATWEKDHIVAAISFELNMVETKAIQERVVNELLANVDGELASRVAKHIGLQVTAASKPNHGKSSPALSMDKPADAITGRKVAILAADGVDADQVTGLKKKLLAEGALAEVIAKTNGTIKGRNGEAVAVDRAAPNAASVIYDAVFVPGGAESAATVAKMGAAIHFLNEAYAHGKPIAAMGEGVEVLGKTAIEGLSSSASSVTSDKGLIVAPGSAGVSGVFDALKEAMKQHRFFDRDVASIPA